MRRPNADDDIIRESHNGTTYKEDCDNES